MESGQSTYQQVESFHWDKREIYTKKPLKKGVFRLPKESSNGRYDDMIIQIGFKISNSIMLKL